MIVCGIELAASEARLVILDGAKAGYSLIKVAPPKIVLADSANQDQVKGFKETIYAFLRENHIEKVAIKKRNTSGDYAGGPTGFKLEGVIQLYSECCVELLSPQTISAAKRNHSPVVPQNINKYQHVAFETAFTALD